MKEYLVVNYKPSKSSNVSAFSFGYEKLNKYVSDFLNEYARQGWRVVQADPELDRFLLERDRH